MLGQPDALRVLLDNLVDNALRYTPAGGRVDVEVGEAQGWARLKVADNGPGIPPAERERVFDRFYRLSGTDVPGCGLGLAIVGEIVRQHGGRVRLLDSAGGGLTVQIDLPLADVPAGAGVAHAEPA